MFCCFTTDALKPPNLDLAEFLHLSSACLPERQKSYSTDMRQANCLLFQLTVEEAYQVPPSSANVAVHFAPAFYSVIYARRRGWVIPSVLLSLCLFFLHI